MNIPTPPQKQVKDWERLIDERLKMIYPQPAPALVAQLRKQFLSVCSIAFIDGIGAELQKQLNQNKADRKNRKRGRK